MNVQLTQWHDEATCHWCERQRECVTTNFHDGALQPLPLCWNCLQKAVRVRGRQTNPNSAAASPTNMNESARKQAANPVQ